MYIPKSLKTQRARVLYVLEKRGDRGMHSFNLIRMISWKAPARISELRKDGYNIISPMEKRGKSYGVRYILLK